MASPEIMKILLEGTPAESLFTRQSTEFSCGPAVLATIGGIYGIPGATYGHFRLAMTPDPHAGIHNFHMEETARTLPCFTDMGEGVYKDGIAIANIIMEDEGHYVVFLCREKNDLLYYDPYDHVFVKTKMDRITWKSETGVYRQWAINFAPIEGNTIENWLSLASPTPDHAKKFKLPSDLV